MSPGRRILLSATLSIVIVTLNVVMRARGVPFGLRFVVAMATGIGYGIAIVTWERRKSGAKIREATLRTAAQSTGDPPPGQRKPLRDSMHEA
jgi:predicted RND superfamily exporter protein